MGELDHILAQLEPALGSPDGEPVPLDGGITNRNFRAALGGEEYVIRRHGRNTGLLGIDRDDEAAASQAAAALGIAPAVVATVEGGLVTRFVRCTQVPAPELRERAGELGRALRRFHDCGVRLRARFWVPDLLAAYARIVRRAGGELPPAYADTVAAAGKIVAAMPLGEPRPCHNDLLPGNIIRANADGRLMIVDWEYAGMGHPYFDLGNLSVNNELDEAADERLLAAYHDEPATDARRARLALMRVLSDAREAAWGTVQGVLSELDFDFEGYAAEHFERLLGAVSGPGFGDWLAAA
jgi:thiamine kinase-like enzyme